MINNEAINKDNDSKKIFTMLILIFTLMICTTSATYAFFALSATNSAISGTAATANLTLSVTQADLKTGTNTGVMVPQLETALTSAMSTTNKCVDGNGNIICKVYTITVTNDSSAAAKVVGTITFSGTNSSMVNLKWKRTTSVTAVGTNTTGSYAGVKACTSTGTTCSAFPIYDLTAGTACTVSSGTGCTSVNLTAGGSATYYVVVWIDETGAEQGDTGNWSATVNFEGEKGTGITSTITS